VAADFIAPARAIADA